MEDILLYTSFSLIFILFTLKVFLQTKRHNHQNLHQAHLLFRSSATSVFSLWFGSRRVVIVSSSSVVQE
ncbi:hypothetical protein ACFX15_018238 [Malus domestica]